MGIVDKIANAYSWTKDYILDNVFLDEAFDYVKFISVRRLEDAMLTLSLIENPHRKDTKALHKKLEFELNKLRNNRIIKTVHETPEKDAIRKVKDLFGQK